MTDKEAQEILDEIAHMIPHMQKNGYHAGEILKAIAEYLKDCEVLP